MQMTEYVSELINIIADKNLSKEEITKLKISLSKKYKLKKIPTDTDIILWAKDSELNVIRKFLLRKPTRTISGVAVIAMMTKPYGCPHGVCSYCPGGPNSVFGSVPQSYTGKEPSTLRSIRNHYDPYLIVFNRLEQYYVSGHFPEKVEVVIQGGTFNFYPKEYQEYFVKFIYKAMNDFSKMFFPDGEFSMERFKDFFELPGELTPERTARIHEKILNAKYDFSNWNGKQKFSEHKCEGFDYDNIPPEAFEKISLGYVQKENETAKIRCVALVIETKPDYGKLKHGNEMLRLGCTRVEIGVQSVYDQVLKEVNRGHTFADTIESFRVLKDLGFKITAHYMPGLPLTTKEMDTHGLRQLFENPDLMPDMLKIYPCMVMKGTRLYMEWKKGKFSPISTEKAAEMIAEFKRIVPRYCRIIRVQRDIPTFMTESGVDKTNLRQYVGKIVKEKKIKCNCIRCREAGINLLDKKVKIDEIKINVFEYEASQGKEFFISADNEKYDILFGYCRMRFPSQFLRAEITKDSALIRELHVYSPAVPIGKISDESFQHRGIGKSLMKKAEEIALSNGKKKIVVIAGVGAREYFRKIGYVSEGVYVVKRIQ